MDTWDAAHILLAPRMKRVLIKLLAIRALMGDRKFDRLVGMPEHWTEEGQERLTAQEDSVTPGPPGAGVGNDLIWRPADGHRQIDL